MHPREDVSGVDYRIKYPFWAIVLLILGIKTAIEDKKIKKIGIIVLTEIIILSFLKHLDGWDFILFAPISWLIFLGGKDLDKYRYGWVLNIGLIILIAVEIGRMFL